MYGIPTPSEASRESAARRYARVKKLAAAMDRDRRVLEFAVERAKRWYESAYPPDKPCGEGLIPGHGIDRSSDILSALRLLGRGDLVLAIRRPSTEFWARCSGPLTPLTLAGYGSALEEDFAISRHSPPGAIMSLPYGALALRENYGALALRRNYGDVTDQDLDQMQAELEDIAVEVESAAIVAGEEISSAVRETRRFAEHRKFLYMVGAPAIVIAGISNQKYRMLGIFAAAVGAYVGVKNYQDEQAAKSGGYGGAALPSSMVAGTGEMALRPKRVGPACVRPRRDGKCPPRHPYARHMANRTVCCRR